MRSDPTTGGGLYLHIPFCSAICPYCDFMVVTGKGEERIRFVGSLKSEIALYESHSTEFDTIYFGGGTPSALEPSDIEEILDALNENLSLADETPIFLEANPEDVTESSVAAWRSIGVRTLSLGVQAFDDASLRFLGRRHDGESAVRSVRLALDAGFDTVSVDLIYGLPEQSIEHWKGTLARAVELEPHHLSCYQLSIHAGTPFGRQRDQGKLKEAEEPAQADLFQTTHSDLCRAGYQGYEVSNFARDPRHRSLHNQKYWKHLPYLGFGPSAHSFEGSRRWWNQRSLERYEAAIGEGARPVEAAEELARRDLALEALMLGLRTYDGIGIAQFRSSYGFDLLGCNRDRIGQWARDSLIEPDDDRLRPTIRGLAVADALARELDLGDELTN